MFVVNHTGSAFAVGVRHGGQLKTATVFRPRATAKLIRWVKLTLAPDLSTRC